MKKNYLSILSLCICVNVANAQKFTLSKSSSDFSFDIFAEATLTETNKGSFRIVTQNSKKELVAYSVDQSSCVETKLSEALPSSVKTLEDKSNLIAFCWDKKELRIVDPSAKSICQLKTLGNVGELELDPVNSIVYFTEEVNYAYTLKGYNFLTKQEVLSYPLKASFQDMVLSPAKDKLVGLDNQLVVSVIDLKSQKEVLSASFTEELMKMNFVKGMEISPDGKFLALGKANSSVYVINLEKGERELTAYAQVGKATEDVRYSADGKTVFAVIAGNYFSWDVSGSGGMLVEEPIENTTMKRSLFSENSEHGLSIGSSSFIIWKF